MAGGNEYNRAGQSRLKTAVTELEWPKFDDCLFSFSCVCLVCSETITDFCLQKWENNHLISSLPTLKQSFETLRSALEDIPDAVGAVPVSLEPELRLEKFLVGSCLGVPHWHHSLCVTAQQIPARSIRIQTKSQIQHTAVHWSTIALVWKPWRRGEPKGAERQEESELTHQGQSRYAGWWTRSSSGKTRRFPALSGPSTGFQDPTHMDKNELHVGNGGQTVHIISYDLKLCANSNLKS